MRWGKILAPPLLYQLLCAHQNIIKLGMEHLGIKNIYLGLQYTSDYDLKLHFHAPIGALVQLYVNASGASRLPPPLKVHIYMNMTI